MTQMIQTNKMKKWRHKKYLKHGKRVTNTSNNSGNDGENDLLNLREGNQIFNKHQRIQVHQGPGLGDVVVHVRRKSTWKIGRIIGMIKSRGCN